MKQKIIESIEKIKPLIKSEFKNQDIEGLEYLLALNRIHFLIKQEMYKLGFRLEGLTDEEEYIYDGNGYRVEISVNIFKKKIVLFFWKEKNSNMLILDERKEVKK